MPRLAGPVATLVGAANAGDAEAFLAAFAADAVVEDRGREFRGLAAIRAWSDLVFVGARVHLRIREVGPCGTTFTARLSTLREATNVEIHVHLTGEHVVRLHVAAV
jgi:hypothetical protein